MEHSLKLDLLGDQREMLKLEIDPISFSVDWWKAKILDKGRVSNLIKNFKALNQILNNE